VVTLHPPTLGVEEGVRLEEMDWVGLGLELGVAPVVRDWVGVGVAEGGALLQFTARTLLEASTKYTPPQGL
jgi:hypothetical protein